MRRAKVYDDPEDEIVEVLLRKRDLAIRTKQATELLNIKNKQENLETRLKYETKARIEREMYRKKNRENFEKLLHMYDHNPLKYDVGRMYYKVQERKEKELQLEKEHTKIYKILDGMHGTPKIDVARLAPPSSLKRVTADPLAKLEMERRRNRIDARVTKKEMMFLSSLVDKCLTDTQEKFPILKTHPAIRAILQQDATDDERREEARALVKTHAENTKFIRNDADLMRFVEQSSSTPTDR